MLRNASRVFSKNLKSYNGIRAFCQAKTSSKKRPTDIDCEAAFPTAQLVCCWRAIDAASTKAIGSNIGSGPDLAAKLFTDEAGEKICEEYLTAMNATPDAFGQFMAKRTMYFDKVWMNAKNDGIKQFVILAAGLDVRAWRLPNLSGTTVYELDVLRSHNFKRKKIPLLDMYGLECKRVEIEVDLSDPSWSNTLISHGFNPEERSFFLMEGLVFYLPPEAPAVLFQAVSDIMAPGSCFTGDTVTGTPESWMQRPHHKVLAKYGTKWTFCVENEEELACRLNDVGLEPNVVDLYQMKNHHTKLTTFEQNKDEEVDETKAMEFRDKIIYVTKTLDTWVGFAKSWVNQQFENGDEGIKSMAQEICEDVSNHHGLLNESLAMKKRVVELVLEAGFIDIVKTLAPKYLSGESGSGCKYLVFEAKKPV